MFNGELWDRESERNDALENRRPQLLAAVETIQVHLAELAKRLASELKNVDAQVA